MKRNCVNESLMQRATLHLQLRGHLKNKIAQLADLSDLNRPIRLKNRSAERFSFWPIFQK